MNYFTKEWYELSQKTSAHLSLEEEQQVEAFSEEYFQQLYRLKLSEWLHLQEQVASYQREFRAVKERDIQYKPFDSGAATEEFHRGFIFRQEYIKQILPKEILEEIADLRVYVLDKASRKVINAVTQFCRENEEVVKKTMEEYKEYYKKASASLEENIAENINFHDCIILGLQQTETVLSISFDNSGGFTNIHEMGLANYTILKKEGSLENSWWLYDEIYKRNDRYEVHVLLQNKNMDLQEFIVSAESIAFKRSASIDRTL